MLLNCRNTGIARAQGQIVMMGNQGTNRRNRLSRPIATIGLTTILAILLGVRTLAAAEPGGASSPPLPAPRYLYSIAPTGEFLKMDLDTQAVAALWRLNDIDDVLHKAPECSLSFATGQEPAYCERDIKAMRHDPVKGRVYALTPDVQAASDNPEVGGEGAAAYKVYAFALNTMKLVNQGSVAPSDSLMVSPDGKELYLGRYRMNVGDPWVVDVVDAETLKQKFTISSHSDAPPSLGPDAYFLPDGVTSISGYTRTHWDWNAKEFTNDVIEGRAGLTPMDRSKLKAFEKEDPRTHETFLPASTGQTIANREVFWVTAPPYNRMGFWMADVANGKTSPAIESEMGLILLTPDARRILVAHRQLITGGSANWRFTGTFSVYDVGTGTLVTKYFLGNLALTDAEGGPACFSQDGSILTYLLKDEVGFLDVASGRLLYWVPIHLANTATNVNYRVCVFSAG
jgi:hypothetical protein